MSEETNRVHVKSVHITTEEQTPGFWEAKKKAVNLLSEERRLFEPGSEHKNDGEAIHVLSNCVDAIKGQIREANKEWADHQRAKGLMPIATIDMVDVYHILTSAVIELTEGIETHPLCNAASPFIPLLGLAQVRRVRYEESQLEEDLRMSKEDGDLAELLK